MKKGKCFDIDLVLYPVDLIVSVAQTDDQLKSVLRRKGLNTDIPSIAGAAGQFLSTSGTMVIRLRKYPTTPESKATLCHEAYHAAIFTMEYVNITETCNGSEPGAYLLGYIVREIYKRI